MRRRDQRVRIVNQVQVADLRRLRASPTDRMGLHHGVARNVAGADPFDDCRLGGRHRLAAHAEHHARQVETGVRRRRAHAHGGTHGGAEHAAAASQGGVVSPARDDVRAIESHDLGVGHVDAGPAHPEHHVARRQGVSEPVSGVPPALRREPALGRVAAVRAFEDSAQRGAGKERAPAGDGHAERLVRVVRQQACRGRWPPGNRGRGSRATPGPWSHPSAGRNRAAQTGCRSRSP